MNIGQTISHYEILEKLGEGGMGVVYRANDLRLHRSVAVKFLRSQSPGGGGEKSRFLNEARAAAILDHPNICTVHEIDEVDGRPFIVMALLQGRTLAERLASGPVPSAEAVDIATQAAIGLKAAHDHGIVHRDVKSANIFITRDAQVKILDFGLAILAGAPRLTTEGTTPGTVSYMSPEQARGEPLDRRSDIWSFGVVLYEMLTGVLPFRSEYDQAVIYRILNEDPPEIPASDSGAGIRLRGVAQRCLRKNPADRYQDMDALLSELKGGAPAGAADAGLRRANTPGLRGKTAGRMLVAGGIVAAAAVTVWLGRGLRQEPISSLAILPLSNGSDPSLDYLSDGITESLINGLARRSDLRIISWGSVRRLRGTAGLPDSVGRVLNVESILAGSLSVDGDMVRVSLELSAVEDGEHLWGERFSRPVSELMRLESDIVARIASSLDPDAAPDSVAGSRRAGQPDPEAYREYLRGRHWWNRYDEEGFRRSITAFSRSLSIDPTFAPAYAGLADAYYGMSNLFMDPSEAIPKARAAATRALEIDDGLSEAHASMAIILAQCDWRWREAEAEFRRAIALSPGNAAAHQFFAWALMANGRLDEALQEVVRARELDPLSPFLEANVAWLHYFRRNYDESIRISRAMLEIDSTFPVALTNLGQAREAKGDYPGAVAAYRKAAQYEQANLFLSGSIGYCLARMGERRAALDTLEALRQPRYGRTIDPFQPALVNLGLGNTDEVFRLLEQAVDRRSEELITLKINPRFDGIRDDRRFSELLRNIGLN